MGGRARLGGGYASVSRRLHSFPCLWGEADVRNGTSKSLGTRLILLGLQCKVSGSLSRSFVGDVKGSRLSG